MTHESAILLIACTLLIGGTIWWFGLKLVERLDALIRINGGEPPR